MGRKALLRWYAPRRRAYPWRTTRDPYRILVSEVMLQQTQASRVAPAFVSFLARFPTVQSLARARLRDVVTAWEGLGYNRRALALWEAAGTIVRDHGGTVPGDPVELQRLAGVGWYTAAAVSSVAFGSAAAAVDTNARRQAPFQGSFRQVRGAVVRALRAREDASLATLARETGAPLKRVGMALSALAADGLVVVGAAARAGRPGGRVRLPG